MERKHADRPNSWDFTYGGGRTIENGKAHWPDCLTIWLPRNRALEVIGQLASQLQHDSEAEVSLSFCGEIEQDDEVD